MGRQRAHVRFDEGSSGTDSEGGSDDASGHVKPLKATTTFSPAREPAAIVTSAAGKSQRGQDRGRKNDLFFDTWVAGPARYVEHPAPASSLSDDPLHQSRQLRWTLAGRRGDLEALRQRSENALEAYAERQHTNNRTDLSTRSDAKWLAHVARSGTTADQLTSRVLQVQEDPLANLNAVDALVTLAGKKQRTVAEQAIAAMRDLFMSSLLPSNRKLLAFEEQAFDVSNLSSLTDQELAYAAFENRLKSKYREFVGLLQRLTMDTVSHMKKSCLRCAFVLLASKPEGERQLLDIIINKLGDAHDHVVASDASFLLGKLAQKHPVMKAHLANEVSHFMLTKVRQLPLKSLHYGCTFLNQLPLSREENEANAPVVAVTASDGQAKNSRPLSLAAKLMQTYFTMFDVVLARENAVREGPLPTATKKGTPKRRHNHPKQLAKRALQEAAQKAANEHRLQDGEATHATESKVVSALLIGIKRAFPYCSYEKHAALFDSHLDSLFRLVHTTTYAKAVQALQVLKQIAVEADDQLRAAARRKLRSGKSMPGRRKLDETRKNDGVFSESDEDEKEGGQNSTSNQTLFDRFMNALYAKLAVAQVPELRMVSKRHTHLLTVVYEAMYHDIKTARTPSATDPTAHDRAEQRLHAFVRRLMQVACFGEPNVAAGVLVLVSKISLELPQLQKAVTQPEPLLEDDKNEAPLTANSVDPGSKEEQRLRYDPSKRNPAYSGARDSASWDVLALLHHWHPSVALFASHVIRGTPISYSSDPMLDFTMGAFLERFVYKNPKSTGSLARGPDGDFMSGHQQRVSAARAKGDAVRTRMFGRKSVALHEKLEPVTSGKFASQPETQIPAHELFFHKYHAPLHAARVAIKKKTAIPRRGDDADVLEQVNSDELVAEESDTESSATSSDESVLDLGGQIESAQDIERQLANSSDDIIDSGDNSSSGEYDYADLETALAESSSDEEDGTRPNEWGVLDAKGKFDKKAAEKQLIAELSDDWDESSGSDDGDDIGAAFAAKFAEPAKKGAKKGSGPTFVDASEFAEQLEHAGDEFYGENLKQVDWELKSRDGAQKAGGSKATRSASNSGGRGGRGGGQKTHGRSEDRGSSKKRPPAARNYGRPAAAKRGRRK